MAIKPKIQTLTNSSIDILNAIRNSATTNYQNYVPIATEDADSLKTIGTVIMDNPSLQNEFLNALVNRIGRVIITSRSYSNPWAFMKKGYLEFGETIEEIFVDISKVKEFNPETAENKVWKREIPNVRSAFHIMNYQKVYPVTIQDDMLRQAFLSWSGITDLIAKIVDAMYTASEYDEYQTMKYMLARRILDGMMYPVEISPVTTDNMKSIVSTVKSISNDFEFLSTDYNIAGVYNKSPKDKQYIIITTDFDAQMDVEVLASAFNMDKASFIGRRVLIDGFGKVDSKRLGELFQDDPTYKPLTSDEIVALESIPLCVVDEDFFMIFDNLVKFTEIYNSMGLYWNYFYHTWKTFGISPFANNAVFIPNTPTVTSVTVSPATLTASKGQTVSVQAVVATTNFAPQTVAWSSSSVDVTVNASGLITIGENASGTVTITATSTYDSTKSGTCKITIS